MLNYGNKPFNMKLTALPGVAFWAVLTSQELKSFTTRGSIGHVCDWWICDFEGLLVVVVIVNTS